MTLPETLRDRKALGSPLAVARSLVPGLPPPFSSFTLVSTHARRVLRHPPPGPRTQARARSPAGVGGGWGKNRREGRREGVYSGE